MMMMMMMMMMMSFKQERRNRNEFIGEVRNYQIPVGRAMAQVVNRRHLASVHVGFVVDEVAVGQS
jgi:hypothetical protein